MFATGRQAMKPLRARLPFSITLVAIGLLLHAATSQAFSISVGCDTGRIEVISQFTSCSHTMTVPLALQGDVNPGDSSPIFQAFLVYQSGAPDISQIQAAWGDFNSTLRQVAISSSWSNLHIRGVQKGSPISRQVARGKIFPVK